MLIQEITESNDYGYWGLQPLNGFIVTDFLDQNLFKQVKQHTYNIFKNGDTNTFYTHGTEFNFNDKKIKLAASYDSHRYQHVIFDLSFSNDWFLQTHETIKSYTEKQLKEVGPIYYKVYDEVCKLPPFNSEPNKYVCYRLHLNVLKNNELLSLHVDTDSRMFNTYANTKARSYSVTVYLQDHIENMGGEFYTLNGFVYKPKANSAIVIEGSKTYHGITANVRSETRLAFTMRWAHIDDLFLPGTLDNLLYNINYDS